MIIRSNVVDDEREQFWNAKHSRRHCCLICLGTTVFIWSTLIGAQSLLPSYCGESQGIIGYMYDASSNPDQAREMDSHDRRNINYFYYAWALAFSLAYTIMLVGQFGFLTMANFVMLTLFRRGDEYDPFYWFAQGAHETVEISLTVAVLASLKYEGNRIVFFNATTAFMSDIVAFAVMRRILKLISKGALTENDRHQIQILSAAFFVFDGVSDICQGLIAINLLEGGQTGSIADQGAVAFQAFFSFTELALTGFEAFKDCLRLMIVTFTSVDAKSYCAPPRLMIGTQVLQLLVLAGVIFFYVKIMYGMPATEIIETRSSGCVDYSYQEPRFKDTCVSRLSHRHNDVARCYFPSEGVDYSDCPAGCNHNRDGMCRCRWVLTKQECLAAIEAAGCQEVSPTDHSMMYFRECSDGDFWTFNNTFEWLVVISIVGPSLTLIPLLLALTKWGLIKPQFWTAARRGLKTEIDDAESQLRGGSDPSGGRNESAARFPGPTSSVMRTEKMDERLGRSF